MSNLRWLVALVPLLAGPGPARPDAGSDPSGSEALMRQVSIRAVGVRVPIFG